ncbi:MAG: DEAD/DEAH box helicase [Streptosporangiaceae bacterium]
MSDDICRGLEAAGIFATFPIQALTLPLALRGQDIIGQARTGTGKTLAFGIPLLQMLGDAPSGAPRALVVVPTRELAIQVADDLRIAAVNLPARILTVYGGRAYEPQIDALEAGVDIVVGTPGRLLDLVERRHLNLGSVQALVLDEADKMLDLGFLPDVERIVKRTPDGRQTMLFSATMPGDVVTLARRHMRQPTNIRAEGHGAPAPPPNTRQHVFRAHQMDKIEVLARVLQARDRGLTMVFCQTKRAADQVAVALETRGFAVATVHGDLGQGQRERALRAFRSGKVDVLTATEVAARGLDVDDVTHVVNYECPDDDMTYVHRIGRTGRAGRAGVAVTFVDWRDMHRWKLINDALNLGKPEPEETYSTSEHLYEQLDIPREATGTLPRAMRAREGLAAEALEDIGETGKIRSASGTRRTRDSSASGSSASGSSASGSGRSGARHGGQARGGSGQSRSSSAAVREDGGQAAGGTAKPRRRRRTRAGHDLAAGQASADQAASAGQASAGQASAGQASAGRVSASQAGTGQADSAGQADRTQLDGGQPAKRLGRRRRAARPANSSEETRKAS